MRRLRPLVCLLLIYAILSAIIGVVVAEGTLHPQRRISSPEYETGIRDAAFGQQFSVEDVSIPAQGNITLKAWSIQPSKWNGSTVILLHGLGDNRTGMTGYAALLLQHGYGVLLPDARAHGTSGGELATYGLLERDDIRRWFEWLQITQHSHCIFGLGESMGAAQLLQSLETEPGFCAVIAESSFANFQEIGYDRMGQFFGTGPWLGRTILRPAIFVAFRYARWKYKLNLQQASPEDAVAQTKVPVLLIHGQFDSNIPARHSRQIHSRNSATVLWEVPNADHCGGISTAAQEFETRVTNWFVPPPPLVASKSRFLLRLSSFESPGSGAALSSQHSAFSITTWFESKSRFLPSPIGYGSERQVRESWVF